LSKDKTLIEEDIPLLRYQLQLLYSVTHYTAINGVMEIDRVDERWLSDVISEDKDAVLLRFFELTRNPLDKGYRVIDLATDEVINEWPKRTKP
jgi:hypothetical protein